MANPWKHYLLTGVLTTIPLMVTVFVTSVFLDFLSNIGRPKTLLVAKLIRPYSPDLAHALVEDTWIQGIFAVLLTLLLFLLLGWTVSKLIGRRILNALERLVAQIPVVTTVYGATKQLIDSFSTKHERLEQVVLIEFPREGMKAVGFVTRMMRDESNGGELAAVYVPTAPNPTGGYLVITPVSSLTPLDWSVDQAMTFVISAGATAPDSIRYDAILPRSGQDPECGDAESSRDG